jgi:hypothetical protein
MNLFSKVVVFLVGIIALACSTASGTQDIFSHSADAMAGDDLFGPDEDAVVPTGDTVLPGDDLVAQDLPEPDLDPEEVPFAVVDTGQDRCFNDKTEVSCVEAGAFAGQDAQYHSFHPSYVDNGDGTVTDLVTGLMWQQDPGEKMTFAQALAGADSFALGGHDDWRLPTIKELYSLIDFTGVTAQSAATSIPYIDTDFFAFEYGDESAGERFIDSQFATSTLYVSTTMGGEETMFGVNFADGRIKGYPTGKGRNGQDKTFFVLYVRGSAYGENEFSDQGDGTVADAATGLVWQQADDGIGRNWQEALNYCEGLELGAKSDWRLPNAKELQGIVDYTRSPDTTDSAAIDPIFAASEIEDPEGETNFAFYWTNTTHLDGMELGSYAVYVAFGKAQGFMEQPPESGNFVLMDVHGAGAQRSDPKVGDPADYPNGHGPQGDVIGILNLVRCVRGGGVSFANVTPTSVLPEDQGPGPEVDCGNGQCEPGEEVSCPQDCGGEGPISCETEADCQGPGACPEEAALGCTCVSDPMGQKMCVPACETVADCPNPPDVDLICGDQGFCLPEGGGPPPR